MREVEVKARIKNLEELKENLNRLKVIFSEPLMQHDKIYFPEGMTFGNIKVGIPCMRLRDSNGIYTWNMKKAVSSELDNIEHETEIDNPEEADRIIKLLGFHEEIKVSKARIKCNYKDYEICIDEVEDLGNFIEVEKLIQDDDKTDNKIIEDEMINFLESLNIKKEDRVLKGYDTLTYENNMKDKK